MRSPRSLPALVSLRAFEAAARRLSFSLAGEELYVTQSAISHHIQKLEAELGAALFERRTRAVALTPAGRLLRARACRVRAAAPGHRGHPRAAASAPPAQDRPAVVLRHALAGAATAGVQRPHPDIELQLQPDIGLADVAGGEVDAAIRYGRGPGPACARAS